LFLFRPKLPIGSLPECAEFEWADGYSHQTQYFHAESFEHAANLAVFSFIQRDLDPAILFTRPEKTTASCG